MKFILTFLSLIISNILFAQNNAAGKQNNTAPSAAAVAPADEKKDVKKVRYCEKRTKPVYNSRAHSGTKIPKKPLVRKAENPNKVLSK
ncbi:MAG TPA: hypothetical protein VJY62_21705 [Bacteroidia bacterium]|nr:hypothetical protein [Bacteroidia bacterium]